jgi:putative copper resistance protein D
MAGTWQVQVILRHTGQNDITQTFIFPLGVNAAQIPATANPVPASVASIASGQTLYTQKCVACHGPLGKGDGPIGHTLNPPPADLSMHVMPGVHSDGDLFGWITNGYPGSAMPAFDRSLGDKQRWDLVNFIRTLAK